MRAGGSPENHIRRGCYGGELESTNPIVISNPLKGLNSIPIPSFPYDGWNLGSEEHESRKKDPVGCS